MPTLEFKGKQHIYAHHLTVPYRPLVPETAKSYPPRSDDARESPAAQPPDGNLIIHGDNLHALKALLPRYAGRVKCIYIDPPYNTGNEGWAYNDNVNSPLMQQWLAENGPVDSEDLERHDKWLCMMWPRLHLLKELLADDGVIFVSIDDNEQHHLRMVMDEIFGEGNSIAQLVVQTNPRGRSLRRDIAQTHEYVLMYAKDLNVAEIHKIPKSQEALAEYDKADERGSYRLLRLRNTGVQSFNRQTRPNLFFPIYVQPTTGNVALSPSAEFPIEVLPVTNDGVEGCWTWSKEKINNNPSLVVGQKVRDGNWRVYRKDYLEGESLSTRSKSLLTEKDVNHEVGKETLTRLFGNAPFEHPKSPALIASLIRLTCDGAGIILDSFAGSGTTAHAVLALNKEDGGNRKFILVECEDYADSITAERMRRVISGVPNARDESLREGLGGSFSYCTLGEPIELEGMLSGEALPSFPALAAYLLHTATGVSAGERALQPPGDGADRHAVQPFYSDDATDYYLLYEPSVDWLRSSMAVLNEERAQGISAASRARGRKATVFAAGKYIGQRELTAMGITFCQLPYEMHRSGA